MTILSARFISLPHFLHQWITPPVTLLQAGTWLLFHTCFPFSSSKPISHKVFLISPLNSSWIFQLLFITMTQTLVRWWILNEKEAYSRNKWKTWGGAFQRVLTTCTRAWTWRSMISAHAVFTMPAIRWRTCFCEGILSMWLTSKISWLKVKMTFDNIGGPHPISWGP